MPNASNVPQIERAGRKQLNRREQELADLRELLATPAGRRQRWADIEKCRIYETVIDSALMAFAEGQRSIGRQLIADTIEANPQAWLLMQQENFKRVEEEKREQDALARSDFKEGSEDAE